MANALFTGSGVAMVTPFTNTGVNFDAFGAHIDWLIDNKSDALIACGTTGEPSTMTGAEKSAVIEYAINRAHGRVPVIAGTGGNNTAAVIEASKQAESMRADGLLIVTPYYNKTTQAGMIAHYYAVADAVNLPIIVYNVPSRTGLNMAPSTMAKLAEHPNIRGMKEASANIEQIVELMRLCGERIALYSGNDDHVLPLLPLGGKGVISVVANIAPLMMHEMVMKYMAGDIVGSRELQFKLNPLTQTLFLETNPIPVKTAMNLMGKNAGSLRLPLVDMTEGNKAKMAVEMQKLGLIS